MTLRLDRYAPEWARGIVEDLDAGITGHEAVSNATAGLRQLADDAEQRAILADQHADEWNASKMICATDHARKNRELGQRMRLEAEDLRRTAGCVATLRGEYIAIARLLR